MIIKMHTVPKEEEIFWTNFLDFMYKVGTKIDYTYCKFTGIEEYGLEYQGVEWWFITDGGVVFEVGNDS